MTSQVGWFKSTFSAVTGECVEVARTDSSILVRDSKDPNSAQLTFTHSEWRAFVKGVANGEFDV